MAEEKKKKIGIKKADLKPKPKNRQEEKSEKSSEKPKKDQPKDELAVKQSRSLIMFVSAVLLISIIFIKGDMVWLWLHNAVRGTFSMLSLYWPLLLLFLAFATMIENKIPKLWFRTCFASGFVVALNACIYIFSFGGDFQIKTTFDEGIEYRGGGALGFLFGVPFVKLFGVIPAKILIILILIVLLIFALNINIKELYSNLFHRLSGAVSGYIKNLKKRQAQKHPIRIADDSFFDDDFDEYDISGNDDDGDFFENVSEGSHSAATGEEDRYALPQSPVFTSGSTVDDDDFYGTEEFENENNNNIAPDIQIEDVTDLSAASPSSSPDDDYSIDIDIDGTIEPRKEKKRSSENKSAKSASQINLVKTESEVPENISDEELFEDIFGGDFMDTMQSDYSADASKAAKEISESKVTPKKSVPDQKQFDPQTVSIDEPERKKVRNKNSYLCPPVELLSEGKKENTNSEAELKENAKKLIETLESFSVHVKIVGYCRGPSITRYEIQPAPGVKISKITGLSDDIALNLAADGVRMEAPIPGKPAIGIEIPNRHITSVTIRELLESKEFQKNMKTKKLECVLGKDVAGKIITTDLAKMPHLLIAGTTGSGKSVCVNSILMSILFRASPDEVKMILIDPKLVEFSKYKGIPHLLVPVVSDVKKAAGALNWAVNEMEERYKEFSLYNVKDIDSFNKMVERNLESMTEEELEDDENLGGEVIDGEFVPPKAKKKMPKIVIAIDELADLMMVAPGEVEDSICRLAQKARAAGMHLVIATQRPSVNVITGVIKANIPSRISLKVASYIDSKTILDTGGGEKLIGRGDMLYSPVGAPKPIRVQGGYSSDDDIEAVTDFIKGHNTSEYDHKITEQIEQISEDLGTKGGKDSSDSDDVDDSDPMLDEAIRVVVEAGQASTSLLQRRLRLGYARAGRLIDTMEQMGIVGPHEGSKSRKVLLTEQQWIERKVTGSAE